MDLREMGLGSVDWISLAHDKEGVLACSCEHGNVPSDSSENFLTI
jgi:hypothetical protein